MGVVPTATRIRPSTPLAGLYLLAWALRRERRDRPAVTVVCAMLLVAAVSLVVISLLRSPPATPVEPAPRTPYAPKG